MGIHIIKKHSKITANSKLTFGKHKGELVKDVPTSYLVWCHRNIDWFKNAVDKEVKEAILNEVEDSNGPPHDPTDYDVDYITDALDFNL